MADDGALSQDEIDALLNSTGAAVGEPEPAPSPTPAAATAAPLTELIPSKEDTGMDALSMLDDVALDVKIELGRTYLDIKRILSLNNGSIVELDKLAGDPCDVLVNGKLVARGEVLVLNENFSVRVTEVVSQEDRINFEKRRGL